MVVYAPMRSLITCYIGLNENAPPMEGSHGEILFVMIRTCDFVGACVAVESVSLKWSLGFQRLNPGSLEHSSFCSLLRQVYNSWPLLQHRVCLCTTIFLSMLIMDCTSRPVSQPQLNDFSVRVAFSSQPWKS